MNHPNRRLTKLYCQLGRHWGHFTLEQVQVGHEMRWSCRKCMEAGQ